MDKILMFPLIILLAGLMVGSVYGTFATGDPALAPNPVPSACLSNCKPILVEGPTLGPAIVFSIRTSITGRFKVVLGPTPFNLTLTDNGVCIRNQTDETPIPINSFGAIAPLGGTGAFGYCLYYTSLPAAKSYSLEVTFKHPGDMNFIQTISWVIP